MSEIQDSTLYKGEVTCYRYGAHNIDVSLPGGFDGTIQLKYNVDLHDNTLITSGESPCMFVTPSNGQTQEVVMNVYDGTTMYVAHDTCTGESLGIFRSLHKAIDHLTEHIDNKFEGDGTFETFKHTKRIKFARFTILKLTCDCMIDDWCKEVVWSSDVERFIEDDVY